MASSGSGGGPLGKRGVRIPDMELEIWAENHTTRVEERSLRTRDQNVTVEHAVQKGELAGGIHLGQDLIRPERGRQRRKKKIGCRDAPLSLRPANHHLTGEGLQYHRDLGRRIGMSEAAADRIDSVAESQRF